MPRPNTFNSALTDPDPPAVNTSNSIPQNASNRTQGGGSFPSRGRGGFRGGPRGGGGGAVSHPASHAHPIGRGGGSFSRALPPHQAPRHSHSQLHSSNTNSGTPTPPRVPHPSNSHSHVQNEIVSSGAVQTRVGGKRGPDAMVVVTEEEALRSGVAGLGVGGEDDESKGKEGDDSTETEEEEEEDEEAEEDTCFICAEKITYWSVGMCSHRTCHICALRLRVFYKKTDCTFCKTDLPTLLFTSSPTTPFPTNPNRPLPFAQVGDTLCRPGTPRLPHADNHALPGINAANAAGHGHAHGGAPHAEQAVVGQLDLSQFPFVDEKLGVVFETAEMMEATLLLLRFNCPEKTCSFMAAGWDGLEKHTLSMHGTVLCHLCRRQLSRFAHEQILYPPHLLPLHDPSKTPRGHRRPQPRGKYEEEMVEVWGMPHPMCEFCHEAFFSSDELFKHMRNRHEECFVCKEKGDRDVYFQNYQKMEAHFTQAHFPCLEKECLEKKFVVFGTELDWRAHMMAEHEKNMSAKDRHQARQLPIEFIGSLPSDFSFIPPEPDNTRRGQGRGNNNNNPNRHQPEPMNNFSRPGARARDAPQFQQLEHNHMDGERSSGSASGSGGNRQRGFGAQLTREQNGEGSGSNSRARSGANTPRDDVDDSVTSKHAELLNRLAVLVEYSEAKLSSFRHAVRQYKNGEAPAKDMVDTVYTILNRDADETIKLLREVSGLMAPDEDKVQGVLAGINVFKLERQAEFPTLAGPSSVGTEYSGIASGTVLNAKRVTQTRGNANSMWDRIEQAAVSGPVSRPAGSTTGPGGRKVPGATSAPQAFPALSGGGAGSSRSSGTTHSTPWASSSKAQSGSRSSTASAFPAPPAPRSVYMPSTTATRPGKAPKLPSTSLFPSLPPAKPVGLSQAERQALFGGSTAREDTLRRMGAEGAPPVSSNGWTTVGTGEYVPDRSPEEEMAQPRMGGGGGGGGGGKKKKKETLFTISARPT